MADALLRFVHISDTHISHDPNYNLPEADYTPVICARALVEQLNALPFSPDFVLHTGDVIYDPDPQAYRLAREVLGAIKHPVYYLVGNHDDAAALQRDFLGRSEARAYFDYEFEVNGVQILCMDSNAPAPRPAGAVTDAQLAWLEARCAAHDDRPLLVAVHHNALPIGAPWWDTFMRMTNGEDFHRVLLPARHRLRGVFSGHVHQPTEIYRDGILYCHAPSSWYQIQCWPGQVDTVGDHSEPGFSVVTITHEQTFVRRHRFKIAAPSG